MKTLNKTATKIFLQLVEKVKANADNYIRINNAEGVYMPLNIEKISDIASFECFSMAHYGEQNGDLMADPEMCFLLAKKGADSIVIPYSFRNDYMGVDRMDFLIENNKIRGARKKAIADNVAFANMWLKNIKNQQNL